MKTKTKISAYILRGAVTTLLVSCVIVALSSAISLPNKPPKVPAPQNSTALDVNGQRSTASAAASAIRRDRTLTFADRVAYQRAIEEVYWRHRIWPAENATAKPSLDKVMSQAQIEKKVEDYLRNSQALEDYWQWPITPDQLQAEMERIASHTKQPGVLRELFAALGNDSFVIAECLARPVLAERLLTELNNEDRVKPTRIAWQKQLLQPWIAKAEAQVPVTMAAVSVNYTLPVISGESDDSIPSVACTNDTWTATSTTGAPEGRVAYTAVWTGSEMIVWGGVGAVSGYLNTGGRYNPSTDSWTATSLTNAPAAREQHTAVWTGSQMIVWGGVNNCNPCIYLNTGGRYNPSTDSWIATGTTSAPDGRYDHTAVWTGSQMIVWGGVNSSGYLITGGRYTPGTDSWTATSTTSAPSGRALHTAVWTGSKMIVWGGTDNISYFNTGGRYSPGTDSWTATSTTGAPTARYSHTAVWTGGEMIVWGGLVPNVDMNTGGRYNPSTDSWIATSTTGAPTARELHTAVWTRTEMIVWGGINSAPTYFNTGGRYDPSTDSWTTTSTTGAPAGRDSHTAVWTGSEMIVWGGTSGGFTRLNTGGRYCAPPAPAATTNPATNIASFSATLNGSLNPRGSSTTVYFEYGPSSNYGSMTARQTQTGNKVRAITANISGLSADTTYHFQIVAQNGGGTALGGDSAFTTLTATGAPVVITNPATNLTSSSATLNGSVDPHGLSTTVHFEYGTTTSYGHTTANRTKTGDTYQNVFANISGLATSTTYHFRIVATNSGGTTNGADRTFTLSPTGPPVVITNPATLIASFSATLDGSVNPHGLSTIVYFQYGTTTSYGSTTANQSKSGNTFQNVSADISGLSASTTYHFRIVATNSAGTTHGADRTFTTLSATGPPVAITNAATNLASSSATLNGTVDPHGLSTTVNFQYGTTTSYGHTTANQTKTGNTYQSVSANISGLAASTKYHFRVVATNSSGTADGSDKTFTTKP